MALGNADGILATPLRREPFRGERPYAATPRRPTRAQERHGGDPASARGASLPVRTVMRVTRAWPALLASGATALVTGAVAHLVFDLDWTAALLMGAVLAPTDPAILIPLFIRSRLRPKIAQTVVAEALGPKRLAQAWPALAPVFGASPYLVSLARRDPKRLASLLDDDPERLAAAVETARMPADRPQLYGDGNASLKVAVALRASLARS